jgi:ComF family protein
VREGLIRAVGDALTSVILAPCCACCSERLESPTRGAVCETCWAAVQRSTGPLCRICGDALAGWRHTGSDGTCARCTRSQRVISIGRSIGSYEGTLRDILHALKYDGRRSVAKPLAAMMRIAGADVLDGADAVVPVPLHVIRQYSRGFNQAAELAGHLELPVVHALRRARATVTQTDLPETQRHANVHGAFTLRTRILAGSVLVVVDDVSTTGATLDACAKVLLDAGAKEVRGLTAARAAARLP